MPAAAPHLHCELAGWRQDQSAEIGRGGLFPPGLFPLAVSHLITAATQSLLVIRQCCLPLLLLQHQALHDWEPESEGFAAPGLGGTNDIEAVPGC